MLSTADDEQMAFFLFRSHGICIAIQESARTLETNAADALKIGLAEQYLLNTNVVVESWASVQGYE